MASLEIRGWGCRRAGVEGRGGSTCTGATSAQSAPSSAAPQSPGTFRLQRRAERRCKSLRQARGILRVLQVAAFACEAMFRGVSERGIRFGLGCAGRGRCGGKRVGGEG